MRVFRVCISLAALLAVFGGNSVCRAQSPAAPSTAPAFEVASVKVTPFPADGRFMVGSRFSASGYDGMYITMRQCIQAAYDVRPDWIIGPAWITSARYSINAKASAAAPQSALRLMLQRLLAERFGLKVHTELQEQPVYALVAGKNGIKLKPVEYDGADRDSGFHPVNMGLEVKHTSMAVLAKTMSSPPFLDRPVIDMTGVEGLFDFTLRYATRGFFPVLDPPEDATQPSIFLAFQDIGLKLEPRKAPVECIVIDQAMQVPTEN